MKRLFHASRFQMAPRERVRGHRHAHTHLLLLIDGAFEESVAGEGRAVRRGEVRLSAAGAAHEIDGDDHAADCFVVHLSPEADRLITVRPETPHRFLAREDLAAGMAALAEASRSDTLAPIADLELRATLRRVDRLAEDPDSDAPPAWLAEARAALLRDPAAAPDVRRLASWSGVTREHLSRAFRRFYGASAQETRMAGALARALTLLASTSEALVDVALDAGFSHQSHLANAVKAATGLTPGAYRRSADHMAARRA